eukprot:scaffold30771_cov57-Phaeocystis_antarctica.AAC.2
MARRRDVQRLFWSMCNGHSSPVRWMSPLVKEFVGGASLHNLLADMKCHNVHRRSGRARTQDTTQYTVACGHCVRVAEVPRRRSLGIEPWLAGSARN